MPDNLSRISERRPRPLAEVFASPYREFFPDLGLQAWIRETFIDSDGPLFNPDHQHLQSANIGCLWTARPNNRQMRSVIGQAEMPQFQGNAWTRGRQIQQIIEWFVEEPDFILTFSAHAALGLDDASWCALVEHELYHCAQAVNQYGLPKFNKDGMPVFAIKGHDVEEFIGVIRRYGVGASGESTQMLVQAAQGEPEISRAMMNMACGTCAAPL